MQDIFRQIKDWIEKSEDRLTAISILRKYISDFSTQKANPVDFIQWIPVEQIQANDYNPNVVAEKELWLLYISILHDGYTQPIVTVYDDKIDKYVIVDGFHRYYIMKLYKDIYERCQGLLPVVVLNKSINDRMASTIRHNRARGKHTIKGMSNLVFKMLENGWEDDRICNELGMEAEEILRLKHITGFSKLFENRKFSRAWIVKPMRDAETNKNKEVSK